MSRPRKNARYRDLDNGFEIFLPEYINLSSNLGHSCRLFLFAIIQDGRFQYKKDNGVSFSMYIET